jgi:hypothetical protein
MKQRIAELSKYVLGREYLTERSVQMTKLSRIVNTALALGKIGIGIYSHSLFPCVSGFYNIGITAAKHIALRDADEHDRLQAYGRVGAAIVFTSVLYLAYALNMALRGKSNIQYDIITSLTIATFTFTEIAIAVRGVITARQIKNLKVEAIKRTNLVCSLISLVLTESALLSLENAENAAKYCGWTGLIFGGVSVAIGTQMIIRARREGRVKTVRHISAEELMAKESGKI